VVLKSTSKGHLATSVSGNSKCAWKRTSRVLSGRVIERVYAQAKNFWIFEFWNFSTCLLTLVSDDRRTWLDVLRRLRIHCILLRATCATFRHRCGPRYSWQHGFTIILIRLHWRWRRFIPCVVFDVYLCDASIIVNNSTYQCAAFDGSYTNLMSVRSHRVICWNLFLTLYRSSAYALLLHFLAVLLRVRACSTRWPTCLRVRCALSSACLLFVTCISFIVTLPVHCALALSIHFGLRICNALYAARLVFTNI
jgi:hypothetical protein